MNPCRVRHTRWSSAMLLLPLALSRPCAATLAGRAAPRPAAAAFVPRRGGGPGHRRPTGARGFRSHPPLRLNRILFDACEIDAAEGGGGGRDDAALATVTLPKDDYRTIHVAKILGLQNGDTLRAGAVRGPGGRPEGTDGPLAGLVTDAATVTWLPEGKIKKAQPTRNGEPPGSLRMTIPHPPASSLWSERNATRAGDGRDGAAAAPPVSLLLALPRPLQLQRLLPMISQLGVDQLVLTNAKKVPKDYFGAHVFRDPARLRGLLVEGLAQSGDVTLPNVTVTKRLKIFMEDEFDALFPPDAVARVIAHPERTRVVGADADDDAGGEGTAAFGARRMTEVAFPAGVPRRIVVAVGPEGGWEEPYELDLFANRGFQQITLGTRVLRSDVAVVSLLALAHEACATDAS